MMISFKNHVEKNIGQDETVLLRGKVHHGDDEKREGKSGKVAEESGG